MARAPLILLILLLAGCATSDKGRAQLLASDDIGAIYSDLGLRARLVAAADKDCSSDECEATAIFRRQVGEAGERLSKAAYAAYPELEQRVPRFEFSVPTKQELGTLSNTKGSVVIFSAMSELGMDEAALNFVVAREMGHIIGRHHQENTGLSIAVSVVAQLIFPMANIIRGAAAVLPTTSAVTAATTSAASMLGTRVLQSVYRQDQVDEADTIAFKLLRQTGWDLEEVVRSVGSMEPQLAQIGEGGWISEFHLSKARLDLLDCDAPWSTEPEMLLTTLDGMRIDYELSTQ
jgi:Zn-dependent protease with chaperone function